MKKRGIKIPFLLIGLLSTSCLSTKAQEGKYGRKMAWLAQFLNPAEDLYQPLVQLPIDIRNSGSYEFDYRHRYIGSYAFALAFDKFPSVQQKRAVPFDYALTVEISDGKSNLFSKSITAVDVHSTYLHHGPPDARKGGYFLFHYSVPEELPLNTLIHGKLNIIKPDHKLAGEFGSATVMIRKDSVE